MDSATYNITNDKLFARFDDRLSPEDYNACKRAGFVWWPGSKQFVAKWAPQAEDWLTARGLTIEEDDTPDNVEARVERFSQYADRAEQAAEGAQNYLDSDRANTERRRKNAVNAIEKNLSAAEHWQERIESAIRHAARKDRPDVIARRIEELEKHKRKVLADSTPDSRVDGARYGAPDSVWVGPKSGRGGHWVQKDRLPALQAWAARWVEHINKRLQYEKALLEAAGGIVGGIGAAPLDHEKFQVGGAIKGGLHGQDWRIITKVNKRTVEVFNPSSSWNNYWKIDRTEITDFATADQVKAAELHSELWHAWNGYQAKLKEFAIIAEIESKHGAELEAFCQARGWGSYKHQGRDSKLCLIRDWQRSKQEVAA
jgi:hypothetical protein